METTLSKKKQSELYDIVHNEVMKARIKLANIIPKDSYFGEQVDNIMYELSISAPQEAIKLFYKNK